MRKANNHILVIRFSSLGDVAITVPVLNALQNAYPNIKLTVLTKPAFTPLFSHLERVSVISIPLKTEFRGFVGLWKLAQYIKTLEVDAIADLHNVLRTRILKLLLPTKLWAVLDKGRRDKKQLIAGQVLKPLKPTVERYADVFRTIGYKLSLERPSFPPPKQRTTALVKILENLQKPFIGIAPFAAHESKTYPLHKMKSIIDLMSEKHVVFLFGASGDEQQLLEKIAQSKTNIISVAGRFSMDEELTLMSELKVMVAMDSGNAHMAAMMGIPVITLWGVTHPYLGFKPFNQPLKNCLLSDRERYPKIPTSVYGNHYPKGYDKAIASIDQQDIIRAIESI